MRLTFLGGALLMTMACAAVPPDEPANGPGESGSCRTEGLSDLIGRAATSELGAEAMRLSGARRLRWIRPGDVVTMDYRPDRLNVRLDSRNRVEGFTCG